MSERVPMSHPDDERASIAFWECMERFRQIRSISEAEARINHGKHQREVLTALLKEGYTPRELKRKYPDCGWTIEQIERLDLPSND